MLWVDARGAFRGVAARIASIREILPPLSVVKRSHNGLLCLDDAGFRGAALSPRSTTMLETRFAITTPRRRSLVLIAALAAASIAHAAPLAYVTSEKAGVGVIDLDQMT